VADYELKTAPDFADHVGGKGAKALMQQSIPRSAVHLMHLLHLFHIWW
jgi:hypothetical protein